MSRNNTRGIGLIPLILAALYLALNPRSNTGPSFAAQTTSSEVLAGTPTPTDTAPPAATIRVPQDQPTIQTAINAAQNGDLILVSPGTYNENITIAGKTITLASQFYTTGDPAFIDQTILDGGGNVVITVGSSVGPETRIIGFTIQNGNDGIAAAGKLHILNNRILNTGDGIDYSSSGGFARNNVFENNHDDGIDLDGATEVTIEDNTIRNNGDDGIEIRLHAYSGVTLTIVIRNNLIAGNVEDGIQLIDYPDLSHRVFRIERNRITNNDMVGLGLMDNGETNEDFRAASIPEPIHLIHNTFSGNNHGVTGGDNLVALNNLFVNSPNLALKNVDAGSTAAYNLFWNNGTNYQGSNIDIDTTLFSDPLLDGNDQLQLGSPAIDAGTAHFEWNGETMLDLPPGAYFGAAPDLGKYETNFATSTPTATPTDTPTPTASLTPTPTTTQASSGTPTATHMPTITPMPGASQTSTPTTTQRPDGTATATPTGTPTSTASQTPTPTTTQASSGTPTPTATSISPAGNSTLYLPLVARPKSASTPVAPSPGALTRRGRVR